MAEGDDLVKGIETLSEPLRVAAFGSWEGFESKRVLMDLFAARAAIAQSRAALEATADHDALKGSAEHEKDLFKTYGKTLPKTMKAQEDIIEKFEELALDFTKASIHHEEALGHPDNTESVEQHLHRRATLFGDAAQAAMRDILNVAAKEAEMCKHAVPKILDAMKASEESEVMPEFDDDLPPEEAVEGEVERDISQDDSPFAALGIDEAEAIEEGPEETEVTEVTEVEEVDAEPGVAIEAESAEPMEAEPELMEVEPAPVEAEREEEIVEDAEAAKVAATGDELAPTSNFSMTLSRIAEPLEKYFKKNTLVLEDAYKATKDALDDYENAVKGASNGRVASQTHDHGFNLSA